MSSWSWQLPEWPRFSYEPQAQWPLEQQFLLQSGEMLGICKHVHRQNLEQITIAIITSEALKTSEIEGEMLNRASLQDSLRDEFGLNKSKTRSSPRERGIAALMGDLYKHFDTPLTSSILFDWHTKLLSTQAIDVIGGYRTHPEPMQIVSGLEHKRKVHFEAPPSAAVPKEMGRFITWFNDTGPTGKSPLLALTRAGLAHLYFETIHPFEDGNGRIGRALAEKAIAQTLGQPSLIALATLMEHNRKDYYGALEATNRTLDASNWLAYFSKTTLEAQRYSIANIEFYISKTKFYDRHTGQFNERQNKVIARLFEEGLKGFKGGLSAENYITITQTSRATATRDLQDLVTKGALKRHGELRHTRYELNLEQPSGRFLPAKEPTKTITHLPKTDGPSLE